MHFFIADALTGAGRQGTRTVIQIGVAAFNILINLWIIPAYGWRGAAWSSIASDGLLALALMLVVTYLREREQALEPRWHEYRRRFPSIVNGVGTNA